MYVETCICLVCVSNAYILSNMFMNTRQFYVSVSVSVSVSVHVQAHSPPAAFARVHICMLVHQLQNEYQGTKTLDICRR
jgi:hypothetical protein